MKKHVFRNTEEKKTSGEERKKRKSGRLKKILHKMKEMLNS